MRSWFWEEDGRTGVGSEAGGGGAVWYSVDGGVPVIGTGSSWSRGGRFAG